MVLKGVGEAEAVVRVRAVVARVCPRVRRRLVATRVAEGRGILRMGNGERRER